MKKLLGAVIIFIMAVMIMVPTANAGTFFGKKIEIGKFEGYGVTVRHQLRAIGGYMNHHWLDDELINGGPYDGWAKCVAVVEVPNDKPNCSLYYTFTFVARYTSKTTISWKLLAIGSAFVEDGIITEWRCWTGEYPSLFNTLVVNFKNRNRAAFINNMNNLWTFFEDQGEIIVRHN